MVKNISVLKDELINYKQPINKINRLVDEGKLFPLVKGIYEDNGHAEPFALATSICAPSYISFESALSYHGLIPERVHSITSASLNKKKDKVYTNHFGTFTYSDIPERVFPLGVTMVNLGNGYSFLIASKEKALCDKLYKLKPVNNYEELVMLLFNDLRIDEDILFSFDINDMEIFSNLYKSTNITYLYKYLKRRLSWKQS